MIKKHMIIPVFVPHQGCPFDCIFCNQKLISGQMQAMMDEQVRETIEDHLGTARSDTQVEIGFYGGSFTGISPAEQARYLDIASAYVKNGSVGGIRLSTRPDYINPDILRLLTAYPVHTIELGVQSLDNQVLSLSCRGYRAEQVIEAVQLIRQWGLGVGIQTMIGLPGDTHEKDLETARRILELKPDLVRIYPTLVIRHTALETLYRNGSYTPLQLDEAVETCVDLLELYSSQNIPVIRIGLQNTDHIDLEGDVLAGPFHPAFRQLVEAGRMYRQLERLIRLQKLDKFQVLVIRTAGRNISNVIGQKRANLHLLQQQFGFQKITVKAVEGIREDPELLGLDF